MIRKAVSAAGRFLALLAVLGLGACKTLQGESGVEEELTRLRGEKGLAVVSASADRALFAARGERILVEPPEGYCLDEESVAVSRNAAFALVADCLDDHRRELVQVAGTEGDRGVVSLPRTFPGILTVSISDAPAYGSEPGALDAFEELLVSDSGLGLLGRGTSDRPGRIVATRRVGGALYVLIHEPVDEATSILAPNFWRGFLGVKDRLVLVTVSCFVDRPMAEDAMMGFLAQQMTRLRRANGLESDPEERTIAAAMVEKLPPAEPPERVARGQRGRGDAKAGVIAPDRAPRPRDRMASARSEGAASAPRVAPVAPARPS